MIEPWRYLTRLVWHGELPSHEAWNDVLKVARENGMLALVAFSMCRQKVSMPLDVLNYLNETRLRTAARQAVTEHQIEQLARTVASLDVRVILLKGPVVASTYPHPAARVFGDVDILVPTEDSARALSRALHKVGYISQAGCREWGQVPSLHPRVGTLDVEVHFQLGEGIWKLPMVGIWERSTPLFRFPGLWEMDKVDHALYMMAHGVEQHELKLGLRWLYDLLCWTQGWGQDLWDELISRAEAWGMLPTVRLACGLWSWVQEEAWEDMPYGTLLSPPPVEIFTLARQTMISSEAVHLPKVWCEGAGNGLKGWLRYGWAILTQGGNVDLIQFPERLTYLLKRHGPALCQLIRRDAQVLGEWDRQRILYRWLRSEK